LVAREDGASWAVTVVDTHLEDSLLYSPATSLAAGLAGALHVSYTVIPGLSGEASLRAARFDGASWAVDVLYTTRSSLDYSLAFDPSGTSFLAEVDHYRLLLLRSFDGASWAIRPQVDQTSGSVR